MDGGGRPGRNRLRVLLVEDSPDIREVFILLLRAEDIDVVATDNGREATDLAARWDFDVVLTDLGLPDIPGDVVIRRILAAARRRPRIIVITGYDEPFVTRARQAGADFVFNKPVLWATVKSAIADGGGDHRSASGRLAAA